MITVMSKHVRASNLPTPPRCRARIVRVVRGIVELAGWFAVAMLALGLMASNAKADTPRSFDEARAAYHQFDWTGWEEDEILDDGVRFLRYTMPTGDALNLTLRVVEADTAQDVEFSVRCAEREWKFGLMTSYEEPGVVVHRLDLKGKWVSIERVTKGKRAEMSKICS